MRSIKILGLALLMAFVGACGGHKSLVGQAFDFVCADTVFKNPYIDKDTLISNYRYIHGGFDDGTKFSFYFPSKKNYAGHFFQYITPFPDSETAAQVYKYEASPISFSIENGAYFVETNEGGAIDFADPGTNRDASIGAYRANAACAEFSRHVAKLLYNCERPYGYCFGGSGGAYRTMGSIESTEGIWDGGVPFVSASPNAIPMVFSVRMNALRVLKDKLPGIIDAMDAGGRGDPYEGLDEYEAEVLKEATSMGFPLKSWYGYKYMDIHGFKVLYVSIVAMDDSYFHYDFWTKPGYEGHDHPEYFAKDRVQTEAVITRLIGQDEAEKLGLVSALSEEERGTADRAWESLGAGIKDKPVAYEVDRDIQDIGMGGDLDILSGDAAGYKITLGGTNGKYLVLGAVNVPEVLAKIKVGDKVKVDNSDFLAVMYYYRHQVPGPDYHVWDQFRDDDGNPIYPQRPILIAPLIAMGAAGCIPDGNIKSKMILCNSLWDRESYAWQADWYRNRIISHLGNEDNFRLWYTDRALHGDVYDDDPSQTVSYLPTVFQALLDLSDWVEKGIEPSKTTDYKVVDGQVYLGEDGVNRGGIQPVPAATVNGAKAVEVAPGEKVTAHVVVDVPKGCGKVVKAEWCLDGSGNYTLPVRITPAAHVEFDTELSYDELGTHFASVRVTSERKGDAKRVHTSSQNIDRVRIIVK